MITHTAKPRPAGMSRGIEADRRSRASAHFSHSMRNPRRLLTRAKTKALGGAIAGLAAEVHEFIAVSYALES